MKARRLDRTGVYALVAARLALSDAAVGACLVGELIYTSLGSPASTDSPDGVASIDDMVSSLAARLQNEPDDVAGWKMLGRSYFELERYEESAGAFAKAVELESASDGQTLADLGQSLIMFEPDSINGEAGRLFETALSLSPTNAKALFYGGMAAINRGDGLLGAERWETLLETSPPPQNVEDLLRTRIAILRGETPPEFAPAETESAALLTVRVELGDQAATAVSGDATVFLIARDPNQPSPPIAAVRRKAAELPAEITLSDSDAMIPGRVPSAFAELEIVAKASVSGNPIAQSGDWFGSARVNRGSDGVLQVRIDQQVP
jgi:cytochrome c-type biogenesis protein CcmH